MIMSSSSSNPTLSKLLMSIYPNIIKPAIVSGLLLGGVDLALGYSRANWQEFAYDFGCLFTSTAAAEIISQVIQNYTTSSTYNSALAFGIVPVISAYLYEYLYSQTVRRYYSDYSTGLRDSLFNYGLAFTSALIADSYFSS